MQQVKFFEPEGPVIFEEKIKRSVFIANLEPCHNETEAKNFLNRVISIHRDANHNCRAYFFGPEPEKEYFSDDGEPSGTAGRPILLEIKKSGFLNVMVIVTRYFGGIKLGTRGLIDAYRETASKALEMTKSVQKIITRDFKISLEYPSMGLITRLLDSHDPKNLKWDYKEIVNVIAEIPVNECEKFEIELEEFKSRSIIKNWEKLK